jgi:hypothetical protein
MGRYVEFPFLIRADKHGSSFEWYRPNRWNSQTTCWLYLSVNVPLQYSARPTVRRYYLHTSIVEFIFVSSKLHGPYPINLGCPSSSNAIRTCKKHRRPLLYNPYHRSVGVAFYNAPNKGFITPICLHRLCKATSRKLKIHGLLYGSHLIMARTSNKSTIEWPNAWRPSCLERRLPAEKHARILLISHAAPITGAVRHLLGDRELPFRPGCCSLTEIVPEKDGGWEAKTLGGGAHLNEALSD